jgi:uncharacterized integral membrane protein
MSLHPQRLRVYFTREAEQRVQVRVINAIGLTPGGSSTVHIYTKTIHITTQLTTWSKNRVNSLSTVNTKNELY